MNESTLKTPNLCLFCHSERSEESHLIVMLRNETSPRFLASLGMTKRFLASLGMTNIHENELFGVDS